MVSVVVPAYNASAFIERTVKSVKSQSYPDWELILVNDGSTDDTAGKIDKISSQDKRILALHQENGGEVSARRMGVLHAKGNWIMFVDADDVLPKDAISSLLQAGVDADIIAGTMHVQNTDSNGNVIVDYIWKNKRTGLLSKEEFAEGVFLFEVQMAVWSKLYKRSLFDKFDWCLDRTIKHNPDLLMNMGLGAQANSIYVTNEAVCYNYIIHQGSASTNGVMPFDGWCRLWDKAAEYLSSYPDTKSLKDAFCHYRLFCMDGLLRHGVIDFPKNDKHIQQLLQDASSIEKSNDEKKVVILMQSRMLRVVFDWWQRMKYHRA